MSPLRIYCRFLLAVTLCVGSVVVGPKIAQGQTDRGFDGCAVLDDGGFVVEEDADRLFLPASVLKVVTAAAAIHSLGPDYRAETRVTAGGPLKAGVLEGDLIWIGGGDPTWNERFFPQDPRAPIKTLVQRLKMQGLRHVRGNLVIDTSRFPGRPFSADRAINEVAFGFAAPTSALAVDEGTVDIRIEPGKKIGAPANVRLKSPGAVPKAFRWINHMITAGPERHERGTVDFQPLWESSTLLMRGEYPISEPPYSLNLAVPDADRYTGELILEWLRHSGIRVDGQVVVRPRWTEDVRLRDRRAVLARFSSPPLREWLPAMLQHSLNWYAEMLLRHLALAEAGEGRLDGGLDQVEAFLLETVGVEPGSFHLDDGSGISPYNLITPKAVAQVLHWLRKQPWGGVWWQAFPGSKKGTLKVWPGLPAGVVAKTGTARHTLALAGYSQAKSKRVRSFACFLGHRTEARGALRHELVAKARAAIRSR